MDKVDNLTMDVLAAERAGMSYGQWKAFHPHTKKEEQQAGEIDIFELDTCERLMVTCPVCGKEFEAGVAGGPRKYCSGECYKIHKRIYEREYMRERRRKEKEA